MPSIGEPGSGGFTLPCAMRKLLSRPRPLQIARGGQTLRTMYQRNSLNFNPELLNDFALRCFIGDVVGVTKAIEDGTVPDIQGTETPYQYGYCTLVVCGAQRIVRGPSDANLDHRATLRALLEHGALPNVPDIVGYTALSHAVMARPRADLARILLEHGADANSTDAFGSVPIIGALQHNAVEAVEVLMEHGADLDIKDADDCTPEEFYIKCGPTVTAAVQKWKRKRTGSTMGMEEKRCAACGKEDEVLKFCATCHAIRYCSRECQKAHWKMHKTHCIPFSPESTVTVRPFYEDIGRVASLADVARQAFGYPVERQPERNSRSVQVPRIRPGQTKKVIIKIQVPFCLETGGPAAQEVGDLMVYDKKRSFVCRVRKQDDPDAYMRISRTVRALGVAGAKAYFPAELRSKDELVVKVKEVLAEQAF